MCIRDRVSGLRGRGGFEVSMQWEKNTLTQAQVKSINGEELRLLTHKPVTVQGTNTTSVKTADGYVLQLKTQKKKTYLLTVK